MIRPPAPDDVARRAEQALRESEERYRSLVELAPIAILIHQEGMVRFANANARRLVGGTRPQDLIGYPVLQLIHPDYREQVLERIRVVLEEGVAAPQFDEVLVDLDGQMVHAAVAGTRCTFEGRDAVQTVALDLTEQRRLEEQLRHAQRFESLGRMAGGVSHDFNNLLTAILGNADLALDRPLDDAARAAVEAIRDAARRAERVTSQLLAFARKRVVAPRTFDVAYVLNDTAPLLRQLAGEDVRVVLDIAPGAWPVHMDPTQLEQVLVNLVVNARDAMSGGGAVGIEVSNQILAVPSPDGIPAGDWLRVCVRDSGAGMDDETRRLAFEPFFTTKAAGRGAGLGLSTCLGIVTQAHGRITIDSAPDSGSTFSIWLPRAEGPLTKRVLREEPADTRGVESVLVVEDEDVVLDVARAALEGAGYAVHGASDGIDAVEVALRIQRIDVLITDVVLPGPSGRDLATSLRERFPELKVLFVSGYPADRLDDGALAEPGTAFLPKPYRPRELTSALRRLLDA